MRKDRKNQEIIDAYDYLSNAASNQDLTGLIPSAPSSAEELRILRRCVSFSPAWWKYISHPSRIQRL